jgi:hypothetical protein
MIAQKQGLLWRLVLPEYYFAESISDFLDNKSLLKKSRIKIISPFNLFSDIRNPYIKFRERLEQIDGKYFMFDESNRLHLDSSNIFNSESYEKTAYRLMNVFVNRNYHDITTEYNPEKDLLYLINAFPIETVEQPIKERIITA